MSELEQKKLRDKIIKGLTISFERLVEERNEKMRSWCFLVMVKLLRLKRVI